VPVGAAGCTRAGGRWAVPLIAASVALAPACTGGDGASPLSAPPSSTLAGTYPGTSASTPGDTLGEAALPTIESPDDVAEFLAGPGRPLADFLAVLAEPSLAPDVGAEECDVLLSRLSDGPAPDELGHIAGALPDDVLGEAMVTLVAAVDEYVTRCRDGDEVSAALVERIGTTTALLEERLLAVP
jgi:hypothetical protein